MAFVASGYDSNGMGFVDKFHMMPEYYQTTVVNAYSPNKVRTNYKGYLSPNINHGTYYGESSNRTIRKDSYDDYGDSYSSYYSQKFDDYSEEYDSSYD